MGSAGEARPFRPGARPAASPSAAIATGRNQFEFWGFGAVVGALCCISVAWTADLAPGHLAVSPSLFLSDSHLSLRVDAGGRMCQLFGAVQAGPEVFSVLSIIVACILLHEGLAMEQLLLSIPGACGHEQGDYADDIGALGE